jgi:hypothetical protein
MKPNHLNLRLKAGGVYDRSPLLTDGSGKYAQGSSQSGRAGRLRSLLPFRECCWSSEAGQGQGSQGGRRPSTGTITTPSDVRGTGAVRSSTQPAEPGRCPSAPRTPLFGPARTPRRTSDESDLCGSTNRQGGDEALNRPRGTGAVGSGGRHAAARCPLPSRQADRPGILNGTDSWSGSVSAGSDSRAQRDATKSCHESHFRSGGAAQRCRAAIADAAG